MEYVAGVSGGALGYIVGGTRGAGNLGRAAYYYVKDRKNLPKKKSMAPTPPESSSRKRKASWSSDGSAVRMIHARRSSTGSISNRSPAISASVLARLRARQRKISYVRGVGAAAVTVRTRSKKRKVKKKISVSKKLREKIKKVISGNSIMGMTQEISYGVMRLLAAEDNKQIGYDITTLNAGGDNPFFSHIKVIDAASVLWNNKAQAELKTVGDAGNFVTKKLKVKVIDSSVTYNFKNNTQRKVNIRLVECKPVSGQVVGNPFAAWQAALAFQDAGNGPNQSSMLVTELYTNPGMLPDLRKLYNFKTTNIEIPAGAEYKHYVQGPKDKLFDLQRAWNGTLFQNYHKECTWVLALLIPDMVTTLGAGGAAGTYGRYYSDGDEVKYGVVFEAVQRYKMNMPEMTGLVDANPAAGTTVQLDQRQFSYAYKTYGLVPAGTLVSVNDENPVQNVSNP